jgi:hypothetical protein
MSPQRLLRTAIMPALELLPPTMDTLEARAMVLAICLQESDLRYRRQRAGGPARGFAQFELSGGVAGVLTHRTTQRYIQSALAVLCYDPLADPETCHEAIEHNDVLAMVFARLLLFTVPGYLPQQQQVDKAWAQYLEGWRPGTPRPDEWPVNFARAWAVVLER